MGLLGSTVFADPEPDEPRVLAIEGDDAERTFDALGSETARAILAATYEEPRTPPELQQTVGTSLQNVHYHLDRLEDANLVTPAGTGYSDTGTEMTVYAPASEALVLFAGDDRDRGRLESFVGRVLGTYLLLATATVAVALYVEGVLMEQSTDFAATTSETTGAVTRGTTDLLSLSDPAVAFFVGGCVTLSILALGWWRTT